jgi:enoyl-CoA hydratase
VPEREPSGPKVRLDRDGAVAAVVLNSPPVNILSSAVLAAVSERLQEAEADPEVRCIVLASDLERAFAAGADIREMAPMGPSESRRHAVRGQGLTVQIESSPLPVVAAVNGACFGGGCEIVQACDLVLASEDATFGQPEINLGIMPGWGGTQRLPRRIGAQPARAWTFLGTRIDAAGAKAAGLVWKVLPKDELRRDAMALAQELATKPPVALAAAKYALNFAIDRAEERGLALERELWSRLFGTPDQREGMAAFLDKRTATFPDRSGWSSRSRGFPWARRRAARPVPSGKGRRA